MQQGNHFIQPVGPVDHGHCPLVAHHMDTETNPVAYTSVFIHVREAFGFRRWAYTLAVSQIGRIDHHVIVARFPEGGEVGDIALIDKNAALQPIESDVPPGILQHAVLQLEAVNGNPRHAPGKANGRAARADTALDDPVTGLRRYACRQHDRIHGDAVPVFGLDQLDRTAEEIIQCFHCPVEGESLLFKVNIVDGSAHNRCSPLIHMRGSIVRGNQMRSIDTSEREYLPHLSCDSNVARRSRFTTGYPMSSNVVSMRDHIKTETGEAAIERLQALTDAQMTLVNETILKRMESPVALIPELAGHLIASGGKRLRPMLTLASAKLVGYEGSRHIGLAAAVEFIHTATLLHDDVVDESNMRRGKKTANLIWGNQPTVLVGDFLFSRSFELMVESDSLRVLKILSNAAAVITEGEVLQLTTANDLATTEDKYLEVITAKTAVLFAAACEVVGVVADKGPEVEAALEAYGKYLGIAFQLVDDALDYSAKQATLGKEIGDDFREGKVTLPVILAYRRGTKDEQAFWKLTMERRKQTPEDLDKAIQLLDQHGTLNDTIERSRHYGAMAKDALAIFEDSQAKKALMDIVDFCISRAY